MFIDRPMPGPRVRIPEFIVAMRRAWRRVRTGAALVASYRTMPAHVLRDIGLDESDIVRAADCPSAARSILAESWHRRTIAWRG